MKPLIFIIFLVVAGAFIGSKFNTEEAWFAHYVGAIAGLFVGSVVFEIYNKGRRKKEELAEKERPKNY